MPHSWLLVSTVGGIRTPARQMPVLTIWCAKRTVFNSSGGLILPGIARCGFTKSSKIAAETGPLFVPFFVQTRSLKPSEGAVVPPVDLHPATMPFDHTSRDARGLPCKLASGRRASQRCRSTGLNETPLLETATTRIGWRAHAAHMPSLRR